MSEINLIQGLFEVAKPQINLTPKAKRTRMALIDAAQTIIGMRGVSGLTVIEVCDAAGIGRTSFYNYFDDVNVLIETVATETAEAIKSQFVELHQDKPRGLDRLKQCLLMILNIAAVDGKTALLITSLGHHTKTIPNSLYQEITLELFGAVEEGSISANDKQVEALARFLTISTLAISREIAEENLAKNQITSQITILLNACR